MARIFENNYNYLNKENRLKMGICANERKENVAPK